MSMLALPESECREILELFRHHLPHVPDAWLKELAANYGQDAIKDIDPNDVIAILSMPGHLHRIQISLLTEHELPQEIYLRMCDKLAEHNIDSKQISASLVIIRDSSAKLLDICKLVKRIADGPSGNLISGWAWYFQLLGLKCRSVTWFVIS